MNSRKITRISVDKENFFDVTGSFDVESRIINLIISFDVLKSVFNLNCAKLLMNPEKLNVNKVVYLCKLEIKSLYKNIYNAINKSYYQQ